MTEGIPLGFAATDVATQLRRMGVGPADIDVFRSERFGHRRAWFMGTQVMMAATLVLLVHNTFAAMQDVAIDSPTA